MLDEQIAGKRLPQNIFGLGFTTALPAFAIGIVFFCGSYAGVGEEEKTQGDHQDPEKQPYG